MSAPMPETESLADQSLWTRIEGSPFALLVKSARSGNTYRVEWDRLNDDILCNCPAGLQGRRCWHHRAVETNFLMGFRIAAGEPVELDDEQSDPAEPSPLEIADAEYNQCRAEWLSICEHNERARKECNRALDNMSGSRRMKDSDAVMKSRRAVYESCCDIVNGWTKKQATANARMADAKARLDGLKPREDTSYLAIDRDFD